MQSSLANKYAAPILVKSGCQRFWGERIAIREMEKDILGRNDNAALPKQTWGQIELARNSARPLQVNIEMMINHQPEGKRNVDKVRGIRIGQELTILFKRRNEQSAREPQF